jgi:hypothetical protein
MAEDKKRPSDGASLSDHSVLDSLYVPVMAPDLAEKLLQFQWMRIHPSTVIALCDDDDESSSVQVSRMMSTYQKAMSSPLNDPVTTPFLRAREVRVDLCDLLDPPLLSDSLFPMCTDEKVEASSHLPSSKKTRQEEVVPTGEILSMDEVMRAMLDAAIAMLGNARDDPIPTDLCQYFSSLTEDALLEMLPTHWIREKIQERVSSESISFAQLSVVVMTLLSEHAACKVMGKYVVSTLAPALLSTTKLSDGERNVVFHWLARLADALLSRCFLGKLSKDELSRLVLQTSHTPDSEAMDELVVCISEAYYDS